MEKEACQKRISVFMGTVLGVIVFAPSVRFLRSNALV